MIQVPKIGAKSSVQASQVLSSVLMCALVLSAAYMFIELLSR
jgi:hypothetical protein